MKKIMILPVTVGANEGKVEVYKLDENDILSDLSRVYIIAIDKNKELPLIYNSERGIWGFPRGHIKKGESYINAALRECAEGINRIIENCQQKFLLVNKIDGEKEEKQIVCFAKVGKKCIDYTDKNESVKKVIYTPISKVISKMGNKELWNPILNSFEVWSD
jgi:ADP-ribose pyrophosphatase YjhB (NUDIX family)